MARESGQEIACDGEENTGRVLEAAPTVNDES